MEESTTARSLPGVTVVMPNANHGRYLSDAIGALLYQTHPPVRILVIDDGSTDDSVEVLQRLASESPTLDLLINDANVGVVATCNRGLEQVTTPLVYFAAADDVVRPGFLEKAATLMARYPRAPVCAQASAPMTQNGRVADDVSMPIQLLPEGFLTPEAVRKTYRRHGLILQGNATVYRTDVLMARGGLPALGPYADSVLILALALEDGACVSPGLNALWRQTPGSYSASASDDVDKAFDLIEQCELFLARRIAKNHDPTLPNLWGRRARYQVLSRQLRFGQTAATGGMAHWSPLFSQLVRWGPKGRRVADALLLAKYDPTWLLGVVRAKLTPRKEAPR